MNEPDEALPQKLLTLWPKLGTAYRMLRRWDHRSGILFIGDDEQGLVTARGVAAALRGKTIEIPVAGLPKAEYERLIGKYLDRSMSDVVARNAGMEQLCVIIPRIDMQPKWLRDSIKPYCEFGSRPLVLLMTCADLEWLPRGSLSGFVYECRKKGATRRSPGQKELKKLSSPRSGVQRSLLE
jgi:hypothetical protein